jgi:hypothetical protein
LPDGFDAYTRYRYLEPDLTPESIQDATPAPSSATSTNAVHALPAQRCTVIDVAFAAVLVHVSVIRRRAFDVAVRFAGAVGTASGVVTLATFE